MCNVVATSWKSFLNISQLKAWLFAAEFETYSPCSSTLSPHPYFCQHEEQKKYQWNGKVNPS